jgi:hypothetical protein
MDKRQVRVAIISIIRLLEGVGKQRVAVLSNPYHFETICRTLERRARFLRHLMVAKRKKAKKVVRSRLVHPCGNKAFSYIKDGVPYHPSGRPIVHANGKPWTRLEIAAELAQGKYKAKEDTLS